MVIQDNNGKFYQVGIFSFYDDESCIRGIPVVYTRLESHLEWIYQVTGIPPQ
jgi:secreted trypsin-like serine protease